MSRSATSGRAEESARRLRPLNAPVPVRVEEGEGDVPTAVHLPGAGRSGARPGRRGDAVRKAVVDVRESWRVDDEWWRRPLSRRYLVLVLEDGRRVTLFRDLVEGRWYLQEG